MADTGRGSELALVFAGDEAYAHAIAVALHSALAHLSPALEPDIYVLDSGITDASRDRLVRVARRAGAHTIRWVRVPTERFANLAYARHVTRASYGRLLIPSLLPSRVRRAIYLDADVLVKADLSPLYDVALGDAPLAAVRDYAVVSTTQRWPGAPEGTPSRPYFNTGLMVIDTALWRGTGLAERALAYAAARNEPPVFLDQDALNAVADSWHELEPRWNVQQELDCIERVVPQSDFTEQLLRDRADLYRNADMLHFTDLPKPWYHGCMLPGTMAWVGALLRSGWFDPVERLRWLVPWLAKRAGVRILGPRAWLALGRAVRRYS